MTAAGPRHAAGGGPGIRLRVVQLGVLLGERYRVRGLVGLPARHEHPAIRQQRRRVATPSLRLHRPGLGPPTGIRVVPLGRPLSGIRSMPSDDEHGPVAEERGGHPDVAGLLHGRGGGPRGRSGWKTATTAGPATELERRRYERRRGAISDTGGDGGTTEVSRTSPEPTANAPATSSAAIRAAAVSTQVERRPPHLVAAQDGRPAMVDGDAVRTGTRRSVGLVVPIASSRRST